MLPAGLGAADAIWSPETPRVHHAPRWRGGRVAARGACAAAPGRMRRIGVLMNLAPEDAEGQARLAAFLQGLQEAGWAVGRNAQIDIRWAGGNAEQMRRQVTEMVALAPDVILASSPQVVAPLRDATRTIPIVFVAVVDPVASGFVDSTTRPGGNATDSARPTTARARNGWSCSRRSRPGLRVSRSCTIRATPEGCRCSPPFR